MSPEELHSAGAIVRHDSPFRDLPVTVEYEAPSEDDIARWVLPYYSACTSDLSRIEAPLKDIFHTIDEAVVRRLLAYFDWRPRIVGGFFAAVRDLSGVVDDVGRLLLRSDVCYAAQTYCLALARFNSPSSLSYLREYLDYYLQRPDLWFDQAIALAALRHLDRRNGTAHADALLPLWHGFVANKPHWSLDEAAKLFDRRMKTVDEMAARLAGSAG